MSAELKDEAGDVSVDTAPVRKHGDLAKYERLRDHNLLGQPQWALRKTLVAVLGLSLVMFMVCASETVFNQVLGQLKTELQATIFAQWAEAAFLLTCVMVQPVWVKLAERFGRPWPLFASV
ncbi:hypothetical protein LPJ70_007811, partial [Coemansia sp. RSA 2708]